MTVTLAYSTYKHRKKEKSRITETIKKLKREKSTVIDNIKRFLIETDIWEVVKKQRNDTKNKWTEAEENNFIIRKFGLKPLIDLIESRGFGA